MIEPLENEHLPAALHKNCEMRNIRRMRSLQKFASVHANVHNHLNLERHLIDRTTYKERRSTAQAEWQNLVS